MFIVYLFAALLGAGLAYQSFELRRDRRRYPPPGRVFDIGSCRLHLNEQGTGRPIVILESGIASTSLAWALVQPEIARFARVASYDRSGLGWSTRCKAPRSIEGMVSELASLLETARLPPPFILVGHSFGGLLIRAYAHLRPRDVSALLFVDPACASSWANCSPREEIRLRYGAKFSRRGALLAHLGIVRAALSILAAGGRLLPKLIARASAPRAAGQLMTNLVGQVQKLPPATWPMIRSHWSDPKCFRSMAAHLACLPEAARTVLEMPIPASIPFTILSASNATPAELDERNSLTRQSPAARHQIIENTGHWIQLERPDAVISALRALIAEHPPSTPEDSPARPA